MSHYTGDTLQRDALADAMVRLHRRGISDAAVVDALAKWATRWPEGNYPAAMSAKTYQRYRTQGKVPSFAKASMLHDFFSTAEGPFQVLGARLFPASSQTPERQMAEVLAATNGSDHGYGYDACAGFAHSYEMYRRSWRDGGTNHVVRSLLRVEKDNGVYTITEVQKYQFNGEPVDEIDRGVITPRSSGFIALMRSPQCLKFLSIHEFYPEPSSGLAVENFRGNMMAVSGKNSHPSIPFACRRTTAAVDIAHLHRDEISSMEGGDGILKWIFSAG